MPADEIDFEDFHRHTMRPAKAPTISIHRDGNLLMSAATYRALGEPAAVILSYGRNRPVVGIRAARPDDEGAYHVSIDSRNASHVVRARSFCNHYGIDRSQARRYNVASYGDRLGIDLTAPVAVTSPTDVPHGAGKRTKARGK